MTFLVDGSEHTIAALRDFLDAARGGLHMPPSEIDESFVPYEDEDIVLS